jgi:hypothetical protein
MNNNNHRSYERNIGTLSIQPKITELSKQGTEISLESFRKNRNMLNFRNENHSTENSGSSGRIIKWNGNSQ